VGETIEVVDSLDRMDGLESSIRKVATLASSKPALFKTFLAAVLRRSQFAEIRNVIGQADKLMIQISITASREAHNPHPHDPPRFEPWRIQIKLFYQSVRVAISPAKRSVGQRHDTFRAQQMKRIVNSLVEFDGIATAASVDQIEIVESSLRIDRLRHEMIEFKLGRDLTPRLALQAIDTSEIKFVAKPRAIGFVRRIP